MKPIYITAALFTAVLFAGCSPSADKTKSNTTVIEKQTDKTQDISMDLRSYTFEKKSEYVAAMKKQLANIEANIAELSAKAEASSDKVRAEAKPKIAALKEQATNLNNQIAGVAKATPTTWDAIKADSSKAYDTLKDGVTQSRQWMSEKIAP